MAKVISKAEMYILFRQQNVTDSEKENLKTCHYTNRVQNMGLVQ